MQVFAIYDAKAGFYSAPMLARSKGEMVRMFMDSAHDTSSKISVYPEDFRLYHIGSFDEETGMITQDRPFEDLGSGLQMQTVRRNMVQADMPVDVDLHVAAANGSEKEEHIDG